MDGRRANPSVQFIENLLIVICRNQTTRIGLVLIETNSFVDLGVLHAQRRLKRKRPKLVTGYQARDSKKARRLLLPTGSRPRSNRSSFPAAAPATMEQAA